MQAQPKRALRRIAKSVAASLALAGVSFAAHAATAPAQIKIGTLYASTGPFAVASQGQFEGLKFWA
ncbi:MAG: amino acid ABC transporter substrate-binding protein, partial [Betaproteobacteria bacterium]|nr:amino acid ABC transporter substrate-binding protein [Betaproteobacteria bacterium]MDE1957226.1 amino acid ABC transporter substrate-binding protein [Betaproteobacteria bacterium]